MQTKAQRFRPDFRISFFTEQGGFVSRLTVKEEGSSINPDVLSVVTDNDMANDCGTFQISLSHHSRWDKVITSNDIVIIQMRRDSKKNWNDSTVFVGLVDSVQKRVQVQEETIVRTLHITGRSLAKALINFEIGSVKSAEGDALSGGNIGWLGVALGENTDLLMDSSAGIIKTVLDKIIFKYMSYEYANGQKLKDMLKLSLNSREGERPYLPTAFTNFEGGAWSFLKKVSNEPFNELFIECYGDGKATLVERPTPFNPKQWKKLNIHKITDMQVMSNDTGRNDLETYPFYLVSNEGVMEEASVYMTKPLFHEPTYRKYGVKMLERSTPYAYGDDTLEADEKLQAYTQDLFNWYIMNPRFWSGEITVIGQSEYKVGDRLLYSSDEDGRDIEYYIEGVMHDFERYGTWTTTLTVTRGLEEKGKRRFEKPWGDYQEYMGGALGIAHNYNKSEAEEVLGVPDEYGSYGSAEGQTISQFAISVSQRSTRYRLGGGRSKSDWDKGVWDCSSFVWYVYYSCGIDLGGGNYATGFSTRVSRKLGTKVSKSELQAGDLIHWNTTGTVDSHVGIYVGNGQAVACNSSSGVTLFDMNSSYWSSKDTGNYRRIVSGASSGGVVSGGGFKGLYGSSHPTAGYRVKQDWSSNWEITAYTTQDAGCNNVTAIGTVIGEFPYHICAVAEELIDYRDLVEIEGLGVFYACDCGGAINGKHIDTLFTNKPDAFTWGTRKRRVRIWTKK